MVHKGPSPWITTSFEQVKTNIHRALLSQLDLEKLSTIANGRAKHAVSILIQDIVTKERVLLNAAEKERIQADLLDEVFGFGPLEPLLKDPTISDILVNRRDLVYIERGGILEKIDVKVPRRPAPAADHRPHRRRGGPASRRIVAHGGCAPGRRIARERDHSSARAGRARALDPPFRHRSAHRREAAGVEEHFARRCWRFSAAAVRARISILISGGTGAGKTTFLNMLSQYIPEKRTAGHHRGCGGIADPAGERRPPGDPASQRGRHRAPCGRDSC